MKLQNNITNQNTQSIPRKKILARYLSSDKLTQDNIFAILNKLYPDTRYSIIIRVSFIDLDDQNINIESDADLDNLDWDFLDLSRVIWRTLGRQIFFSYGKDNDLYNNCIKMMNFIQERKNSRKDFYKMYDRIILGYQILIYEIDYDNIVVKQKNVHKIKKDISDNNDLVTNMNKTNSDINRWLPFNINNFELGSKVSPIMDDGDVVGLDIDSIPYELSHFQFDNIEINIDTDFYLRTINKNKYLYIVNVKDVNNFKNRYIHVFNLDGIQVIECHDVFLSSTHYRRNIGNISMIMDITGLREKSIKIILNPIKYKRPQNRNMIFPDWKIGTMDLETYKDKNGLAKIYATGFHALDITNCYYISNGLNSDSLLVQCLDAMLVDKYNGFTFYVHNFGRYDSIFILRLLIKVSELYPNVYKFNTYFKDDTILSMNISRKVNTKTYSIKIVDSYNILQSDLNSLCKTFNTDIKKSHFPYSFVTENTIFYSGNKPDISYYLDNVTKKNTVSVEDYNKITNNWSTKDQTLYYLKNDLVSLFLILKEFNYRIFRDYNVNISDSLTISGLAMDIYLKKFYNNNIPLVDKKSIYENIKKSYFGGITEVYKPYGKNLYYYDINSLYPYSALNYMPGTECTYMDDINLDISKCSNDLFGFYYCHITTNDNYIGLLPVRSDSGLIMPLGTFEGWYFSEELKFAYKNGYKIKIIKGYKFNKESNVFKDYVEHFYNIKSTTKDPVTKAMSKSLLNNLLGRLGLNINRTITQLLSLEEYLLLHQHKEIKSILHIGDKILVTHNKDISPEICKDYDVDYIDTYNNIMSSNKGVSKLSQPEYNNVSIPISSCITAYSRIHMNSIKLEVLRKGGEIYYMDTDSIVTNIKLDDNLVNNKIGMFKLEYEIYEAYFISNKTYCLWIKNSDGTFTTVIKSKGTYSKNLTKNDFIKLYNGIDVETQRFHTNKDLVNGSVTLFNEQKVVIKADSYKKRSKLYNKGLWVDTKPLVINTRKYHTSSYNSNRKDNIYDKYWDFCVYLFIIVLSCLVLYFLSISFDKIDVISSESIELRKIEIDNNKNNYNVLKIFRPDYGITMDKIEIPENKILSIDSIVINKEKKLSFIYELFKQESYLREIERQKYEDVLSLYKYKELKERVIAWDTVKELQNILNENRKVLESINTRN